MKENSVIQLVILAFLLGLMVGVLVTKTVYQRSAINRGLAIYNPTNATFQWKAMN